MNQKWVRSTILMAWSLLLTALTLVLGGPALKILRNEQGKLAYWLCTLVVGCGLVLLKWHFFACSFLSLALLIGIYSDLEEKKLEVLPAGFFSVLITTLAIGGALAMWIYRTGSGWLSVLETKTSDLFSQVQTMAGVTFDPKALLVQMPSAIVIILALSLFLAVVMDRKRVPKPGRERLTAFRLPDFTVWIFILSLLAAFIHTDKTWIRAVGSNVFNVMLVVYFFQGLAVIFRTYEVLKVGLFWQVIMTALFVVQLFPAVSFIGLVDYWMDFRGRLNKSQKQTSQINSREN